MQLELPVSNPTEKSISGKFALQLLSFAEDSVTGERSRTFAEPPGKTVPRVEWPYEHLPGNNPSAAGYDTPSRLIPTRASPLPLES
jgi:hypothetical protein